DRQILQLRNEEATAARERARLTRDLHDGILQSLTAAGLQLSLLANEKGEDALSRLDLIKQLLKDEQVRIRNFVQQTLPRLPSRSDVALGGELQQILSETGRQWNCRTSLSVDPQDTRVSSHLGAQLSLMVREAISNAVRHGGASSVEVS